MSSNVTGLFLIQFVLFVTCGLLDPGAPSKDTHAFAKSKDALFNAEQRAAVVAFLDFMAKNHDAKDAEKASYQCKKNNSNKHLPPWLLHLAGLH